MTQIKYTLVIEEGNADNDSDPVRDVFTRAMRADSPILRHLRLILHGDDDSSVLYHLHDDAGYMFEDGIGHAGLSVLQAAAIMEINANYHASIIDIVNIPRDTDISFTAEELHTSSYLTTKDEYAQSIAGWTKKQLIDVICELGLSKDTESVLKSVLRSEGVPGYGKRAVRRIRYMIADYNRRRHMLMIWPHALAYPEQSDDEGHVRRAALPPEMVIAIMAAAGCNTPI